MANFFDQFDEEGTEEQPQSAVTGAQTFFDKFDEGKEEANYFDQFGFADPEPEPEAPETPPEEDPRWADYGRMVMQGGAHIAAGVGWLLEKIGEEEGGDSLDQWANEQLNKAGKAIKERGLKSADDWVNKKMEHIGVTSDGLSPQARRSMQAELLGEEASGTEKWNKIKLMTASSLMGTAAGMGAGRIITAGLAKGVTSQAGQRAAAMVGYGAGESLVAAPSTGLATEEEVRRMTHEQLMESLEYQVTLDGLDLPEAEAREKAKDIVARAAGGEAFAISAISTFALSAPFGHQLDKFARGISGKGRLGAAVAAGATEATQEFFQSGGEKLAENIAISRAGFERDLTEGVLENAIAGAASGALMGGTLGAFTGPQETPSAPEDDAIAEIERIQREAEERAAAAGQDALGQAMAGAEAAAEAGAEYQRIMETQAAQVVAQEAEAAEREAAEQEKQEAFERAEKEAAQQREVETKEAEYQRELDEAERIEATREPEEQRPTLADVAPALQEAKDKIKVVKKAKTDKPKVVSKPKAKPLQIEDMRPDVVVDKQGVAMSKEQIEAEKQRLQVDVAEGGTPLPPSELQMERRLGELRIAIETPEGNKRTGRKPDGTKWETTMEGVDYGFVRGTTGADRDQVDTFISTDVVGTPNTVHVIDQINQDTGAFDEHKAMIGFANRAEAKKAYLNHYEAGWQSGPITEMTIPEFKQWVKDGNKTQPVSQELQAVPATEADVEAMADRQAAKGRKRPKVVFARQKAVEQGRTFETGKPVTFKYVRNTESAPDMGSRFQQDIEPGGRYMVHNENAGDLPPTWESGEVTFENPLVVPFNISGEPAYNETSWKAELSAHYDGKTGKELSEAVRQDGYDAIVTTDTNPETGEAIGTREIIDLAPETRMARPAEQLDQEFQRIDEIATAARAVSETMPGAQATVVDTVADLPPDLAEMLESKDALDVRGFFLPKTGEVYIIAGNNQNVEEAIATLLHESVGHKGLRALLGNKLPALLDDVWENGNQSAIREYADRYGFDIEKTNERRQAAEEHIAHLAETTPNAPLLRRVVDAVRAFLRELGVLNSWTDSDIHALLRDVRRNMGKPLSQIEIVTPVEIEETGEVVEIAEQADIVLRQHDNRAEVIEKLRGCLAA